MAIIEHYLNAPQICYIFGIKSKYLILINSKHLYLYNLISCYLRSLEIYLELHIIFALCLVCLCNSIINFYIFYENEMKIFCLMNQGIFLYYFFRFLLLNSRNLFRFQKIYLFRFYQLVNMAMNLQVCYLYLKLQLNKVH